MSCVYHFSDVARLPWIIDSGELRASNNRLGGYPVDFLWATTEARGDRTATSSSRAKDVPMVRFTLDADDFESWPDIRLRHPEWTSRHVTRLESTARARGQQPNGWRCRDKALPLSRVAAVHMKSYAGNGWREIGFPAVIESPVVGVNNNVPRALTCVIGERYYGSICIDRPPHPVAYAAFHGYLAGGVA